MSGVLGLRGWQWLFILEALPSVLLDLAVPIWLPDRPAAARWLPDAERDWFSRRLDAEHRPTATVRTVPLWQALTQRKVLLLAVVYASGVASSYGLTLWQPRIIKGFGLTDVHTGLLNSVPFAFGCVAMVWWAAGPTRHASGYGIRRSRRSSARAGWWRAWRLP